MSTDGETRATRWNGRLTSRPLPAHDATIEALTDEERAACAEHWLARAASERRASDAFVVIEHDLREIKADPALRALAARAIDDELRHAEICRRVASQYARRSVEAPPRLRLDPPAHADAPTALRPALHVVGQCALNETTATAYLEACLARAEGPLVRAALRELLSDDVDHARIGWAFLASSSDDVKRAIAPFVTSMIRAHVRLWRRGAPSSQTGRLAAHGAISSSEIDDAVLASIRSLVLPGLEHVGIPTREVRAWMAHVASPELDATPVPA